MAARGFHPLTVAAIDRLCADAVAVTFAVPGELRETFTFRPGQSLTVRRGEERRTYSICAAAGSAPRIGVREVPGGRISGWLVRELRVGDVVEVAPPAGTFTPDVAGGGRHVLIAAGSGITPVLSIAASLLESASVATSTSSGAASPESFSPGVAVTDQPAVQVSLFYGNRRADTVMFGEELADLKDRHPDRLEIVHVLSREPRESELFSGRLDAERLGVLLPLMVDVSAVDHWWLCGPYAMVTDAATVLAAAGVDAERVHRELFWVDEAPPEPVRPEDRVITGGCEVTVLLDGRSTSVPVEPGTTVLDGAQRARPDLPFACKGGVCGTCRAKLVDGEVTMRRNFALEEAELAAGFVLTCQSVPTSAKVVVDFDQ
ncbi:MULTISPECIES: 2Fe-2S iron-sulfur cluster-binding protein [Actinoplanes]|uniref:2Fe-2S iron-sulfur cluster-binding protein n=1 Tax=Actinoplanes TaxID=1865 RepID=UPI0005F2C5D2|nr:MULTISPECIES: 2Fe-2S iron-sulfur cluster-binding protein [Actinoplanes]GLY06336.1 phenylacetic acid degradation protein [Actinoplanes sp. NBRC 101535]